MVILSNSGRILGVVMLPLVVLYWDIYMVVNQQSQTIAHLWDGLQLRYTFRRTFTKALMI
jgi:predicted membrane protein